MEIQDNNQDINEKICRTLEFFKQGNLKVHFNVISGKDKGLFRNGFIQNISKKQKIFIIKEDVLGLLQYFFEEVDPSSIHPYNERRGEQNGK